MMMGHYSCYVANQIKLWVGCLDCGRATIGVINELILQDILNKNINIIQNNNTLKYKIHITSMVVTPEQINLTLGLFVFPDPKPVV